MSSSARSIAASRANGKKSRGPVTPEGKVRSAANAIRHGLASPHRACHSVCLGNEDRSEFMLLYEALVAEFAPITAAEHLTVREIAVARWRLHRTWSLVIPSFPALGFRPETPASELCTSGA